MAKKGAGMDMDMKEANGACHCGTVQFHVRLKDGLRTARRCNCSLCRMRGAIAASSDGLDGLTILSGQEALGVYAFNTKAAKHYFCSKCGIYTHHQRRSNQDEYGVNVACLEGVSPFDFLEVPVLDGVHHPSDSKDGKVRLAGVLKFVPNTRD